MRDQRLDKLADILVRYSTRVKKGDLVEIGADPRVDLARQLGLDLNGLDEIRIDKGGQTSA